MEISNTTKIGLFFYFFSFFFLSWQSNWWIMAGQWKSDWILFFQRYKYTLGGSRLPQIGLWRGRLEDYFTPNRAQKFLIDNFAVRMCSTQIFFGYFFSSNFASHFDLSQIDLYSSQCWDKFVVFFKMWGYSWLLINA